jgi:hypothetical protein
MGATEKQVNQGVKYANIPPDERRELWLAIFHAITMLKVALVKYLKLEDRCEQCGNKLRE